AIDNPQAIYTLDLICNSGSITWFGADGAIRLELKPLFQGPSRACFLVSSDNSQVKVSQEIALSRNYKLHQIETKVLTKNASNEEFCISSPTPESLHLFIESFVQHYLHSVPKIEIFYDIEKLDSSMSTVYDECKPCTKEEVLDAYCSMDYVIIASLNDVKQKSDSSMSTLTMSVKQIIHQREPEMFHRERRSDQYLTGHITVPTQCGIHSSPGDFLITELLTTHSGLELLTTHSGLELLTTHSGLELLTTHSGLELLTTHSGLELLTTHSGLELLTTHSGLELLTTHSGLELLTTHSGLELLTTHSGLERLTTLSGLELLTTHSGLELLTTHSGLELLTTHSGLELALS
ncbi:meteorin protein, partial [Biomphalaria glabrata]